MIPFKSTSQRGYLWTHDPKVAAEFAAATPKGAKLPAHVKPSKKERPAKRKIERA